MFESLYARAHRALAHYPRAALLVFAGAWLLASAGLLRLDIDLSFRPLFATSPALADETARFEKQFGQVSGAYLYIVLEGDGVLPGTLQQEREALAAEISEVPGTRAGFTAGKGRSLLLAVGMEPPLSALDERRAIVAAVEALISKRSPTGVNVWLTGVTPVELEYERRVLSGQLVATVLTSTVLVLLLWSVFGQWQSVLVCVAPVSLALPAAFGVMGWLGEPVTIINTALPALVLVIGIADAVHMHAAWRAVRREADADMATAHMLKRTGKACYYTTVTTVAGFLSLQVAELDSVAAFGRGAAIGILFAWLSNQVLVPWLSRRIDFLPGSPDRTLNRGVDRFVAALSGFAHRRPAVTLASALTVVFAFASAIPMLDVEQFFNEELPRNDPVREQQQRLEETFGGFLGPELSIRHRAGENLLSRAHAEGLQHVLEELRQLDDVHTVHSVFDLPKDQGRRLLSDDGSWMSVSVRTGDIGTERAARLGADVLALVQRPGLEVSLTGQWWLSQTGMRQLLDDMLHSLFAAMLLVFPALWLMLGHGRQFIAAVAANILPLVIPLGFMAMTGISLRIGTVVVLAIALGIAVDNTMHIAHRLSARRDPALAPELGTSGRAVVYTTLALVCGFLSMMVTDLMVIREMGLVAAVTFVAAMLADLLLMPALLALSPRELVPWRSRVSP